MSDIQKRRALYVLGSRRDRRSPYQHFRYRLVQILDRVLDALADGRLSGPLVTDGQTVVLEDYLEIRPERFDKIEQLLREGKLVAGPWYVLPDELLVSGESLVRNLRLGRHMVRQLGGEQSRAALLAGQSGHSSQMPQILGGLGISAALLWGQAGTPDGRPFLWRGADGAEIPVACLDQATHGDFAVLCERMEPADDGFETTPVGMEEYVAELLGQAGQLSDRCEGELRREGVAGSLRSRDDLRLANAECETLLCHWAEPMSLIASSMLGAEHPDSFLHVAWRWLLQNHAPDCVGGYGTDQVREDVQYRFSQCRQIAERLTLEATTALAANVAGEIRDDELRVVAFNPLPQPFQGTAEIRLTMPESWQETGDGSDSEPRPAFQIQDVEGNELPYQRFDEPGSGRAVTVSLPLDIPAVGYTSLMVRRSEKMASGQKAERPGLATGPCSMENEHLAVAIEPDGTLAVTQKSNARTYRGQLRISEETTVAFQGSRHTPCAVADGTRSVPATMVATLIDSPVEVSLVHDGPMLTSFRIRIRASGPSEPATEQPASAERLAEPIAEGLVSLRPGVDYLDVETKACHPAADQRLRLEFLTEASWHTYLADGPFDVVGRPIISAAADQSEAQIAVLPPPQQTWTAAFDDQGGLAVVRAGLCRYRVVPFTGPPDRARLCLLGQQLAAGLRYVQLEAKDLPAERLWLSPAVGFLEIRGPIVVTSLRQANGAIEIRLFNPTDEPIEAAMRLAGRSVGVAETVWADQVDLESQSTGDGVPASSGALYFPLRAKEIVTFRMSH